MDTLSYMFNNFITFGGYKTKTFVKHKSFVIVYYTQNVNSYFKFHSMDVLPITFSESFAGLPFFHICNSYICNSTHIYTHMYTETHNWSLNNMGLNCTGALKGIFFFFFNKYCCPPWWTVGWIQGCGNHR